MFSRSLWILFLGIFVSDQLTKFLALKYLSENKLVPIIPNFFNLTLVFNPGAAFGMFGNLPDFWRRTVLGFVSVLALIVVFRFMLKEARDDKIALGALTAILAGAVGNIVDRFRFDAVVDFLDFYYGLYHWPAFNIADSAITIGVTLLVVRMLFGDAAAKETQSEAP